MFAPLIVAAMWALFVASHVGLAASPLRARLGPRAFFWAFTLVADVLFVVLTLVYASVADAGPPGLALGGVSWARWPLLAAIVAGFALMGGAFAPRGYWSSPTTPIGTGVRPASGLERITRDPFFVGLAIVMAAHVLLATRLTGALYCAGFVVLIVGGSAHQTRKLRARHGVAYDEYLRTTSFVPLLAVLRGRQRIVWRELPWISLTLGAASAYGVRAVHSWLFAWHGAPVIALVIVGNTLIGAILIAREARIAGVALQDGPAVAGGGAGGPKGSGGERTV